MTVDPHVMRCRMDRHHLPWRRCRRDGRPRVGGQDASDVIAVRHRCPRRLRCGAAGLRHGVAHRPESRPGRVGSLSRLEGDVVHRLAHPDDFRLGGRRNGCRDHDQRRTERRISRGPRADFRVAYTPSARASFANRVVALFIFDDGHVGTSWTGRRLPKLRCVIPPLRRRPLRHRRWCVRRPSPRPGGRGAGGSSPVCRRASARTSRRPPACIP